ncbi:cuticle protein 10.9-like [Stegodyphus dumicola]|uniref:cuticle protein 10.9-like n=1 Tax=Stegodyphus dumicola TaxID=202533 RepID=UPI0015A8257B|nr:cuticle protein 10.9-like [Stegodyphus dumicola]
MKIFLVLTITLAVACAQVLPLEESPKPYAFSYVAEAEDGSSSRSETADGTGIVRGSYALSDIDGRNRVVEYVAGPDGFTAKIRTNEPGTENAAPANVEIESSAENTNLLLNTPLKPAARSANSAETPRRAGVRYVLVPETEIRSRTY